MKLFTFLEQASAKYINLQKKGWMPGLIALVRAVDKGDTVGILTARANKEGNATIIKKTEKMVKAFSSNKNFKFNPNYIYFVGDVKSDASSAEKKADVIKSYEKSKVKFYDDENKNLVAVKAINDSTYDITVFDASKLEEKEKRSVNKIHLFDLDGTIINTKAKIRKIDSDKTVEEFSQEEFADLKNTLLTQGQSWDFKDFTDKEIIDAYMKSYKVFKK